MDWIIEPLIGAIIGCFTNYIAIKMMFRPYNEKTIFGIRIPFTPGIIPRRKNAVAKAIGVVVEENLLNKELIIDSACSDNVSTEIENFILQYNVQINPHNKIGKVIAEQLTKINIKPRVSVEIEKAINEKIQGNIAGKVINEKMVESISNSIAEVIQNFYVNEGEKIISQAISDELEKITGRSVEDILLMYNMEVEQFRTSVSVKYKEIVTNNVDSIVEAIGISKLVENKINSMDMRQLEQVIFSVMKKELNTIIYLGAFMGLIIGLLNLMI